MILTERTLGEICDEVGGTIRTGPFGSQLHESDYREEGLPVVMPKDIIDGRISVATIARIGSEDEKRLSQHKLNKGDIVYGRRGDIGRRALITARERGWLCGTGCLRVSLGDSILHPAYLYYYLGLPRITSWIANQAIGATLPNLNTSILRSVPVAYPAHSTQKKIAAVLSAYDDLIENNTRRIRILEEMAQTIYREWFVHFRFPGHKKIKLVPSPLGLIPATWRVRRMEEVASLSRENINPGGHSQEIFEHFSIPAFDQDRLPILDHGGSVKSNKFLVQESSILLSKLNPKIPRVWLPFPRRTYRAIASTEFLVLIPRRPFTREFLYCLYTSPDFAGLFAGRALGTSTSHQRVKPEDFLRMDVVVPSDDQVLRFTAQVAPMLSAGNTLRLKNANLRRTRELLLPKLISGELDVSDLDINVGDAAA